MTTTIENVQTEYDIRTAADIEKARLEGLAETDSAFENLAMQSKARYVKDCLDFEQLPCFPEKYKIPRMGNVVMERQCLDPDAKISEVVSKMLTWRNQNPNVATIRHRIADPNLSVFANRFITLMEVYEQYYLCLLHIACCIRFSMPDMMLFAEISAYTSTAFKRVMAHAQNPSYSI